MKRTPFIGRVPARSGDCTAVGSMRSRAVRALQEGDANSRTGCVECGRGLEDMDVQMLVLDKFVEESRTC